MSSVVSFLIFDAGQFLSIWRILKPTRTPLVLHCLLVSLRSAKSN